MDSELMEAAERVANGEVVEVESCADARGVRFEAEKLGARPVDQPAEEGNLHGPFVVGPVEKL